MTTSNGGWAWILCGQNEARARHSTFAGAFDGTYTAACPACGQDCSWTAYLTAPTCSCGEVSG